MYVINAVLSAVGPEITVTVPTLDAAIQWFKDNRPSFGYWDWYVVDPEGNDVPDSYFNN